MIVAEAAEIVNKTRRAVEAAKETLVFVQLAEGPEAAIESSRRQYLELLADYEAARNVEAALKAVVAAQKSYDDEIFDGYQDSIEAARRVYVRCLAEYETAFRAFAGSQCEE